MYLFRRQARHPLRYEGAEARGFEPPVHHSMYEGLAIPCLKPLGHASPEPDVRFELTTARLQGENSDP